MDKRQKTKEKRARAFSRALKCLDAHLKSPTLAVFSEKREKTISVIAIITQRLKIPAEVKVKGNAKVAAGVCRKVFRIGQHLVVTKGMLVGIARIEVVVDIREEKFEAVRLRLVGQEAAMNRAENTHRRSSSDEPLLWAKELLSQQKKNELRRKRTAMVKVESGEKIERRSFDSFKGHRPRVSICGKQETV